MIVESLPVVGKYLYTPRWPTSSTWRITPGALPMREKLFAVAHRERVGWVRMEPESDQAWAELKEVFGKERVVPAPHAVQPREILVMDIAPTEEALLVAMKSKTRYNIRLAEKHGVTVRFSRAPQDIERLIELIYATTNRKAIRPHPKEYYRNFFLVFGESECVLALAEYSGKILAANLLVFWDGAGYYLHGGSSDRGRHLMAPYLLQWESIREAKRRGCPLYDFGGVNTRESQSAWAGITRFKQGFAPATQSIVFPGAYDIVVSSWRYGLYRVLQKTQRLRRFLFRT